MSAFKTICELISVNDICEPFISEFDVTQDVGDVSEEWAVDLCGEKGLDPMDQIALVKSGQKVIGWVSFDMLHGSKLNDCMDPINGDLLITSETSLLYAIYKICASDDAIFFVLEKDKFSGYLQYDHFNKTPFRISLLSLILELEKTMMETLKMKPAHYVGMLSTGRFDKAKDFYKRRQLNLDKNAIEYCSGLIDCTTLIDKFNMLKKDMTVVKYCPEIKNKFVNKAEVIRNDIVHPKNEILNSLPIEKEKLIPFIDWVDDLQQQLRLFKH